jgi:hypothetical protein
VEYSIDNYKDALVASASTVKKSVWCFGQQKLFIFAKDVLSRYSLLLPLMVLLLLAEAAVAAAALAVEKVGSPTPQETSDKKKDSVVSHRGAGYRSSCCPPGQAANQPLLL